MHIQRFISAGLGSAALIACGTTTANPFGDGGIAGSTDGSIHVVGGNADATVVSACGNGVSTTVSGKVFDPAGKNPLYGVVVYATTATTLPPLPEGASCATCDSLYAGIPIQASAVTDATGAFKLQNVPAGPNVTLVVQVGKWRRKFDIAVTECTDNPQGDGTLHLPKSAAEGDLPHIAVSTGAIDSVECMLGRIGIDPVEYVAGAGGGDAGAGHMHIFQGGGVTGLSAAQIVGGSAKSESDLWDKSADLLPYDVVLLSCEGQAVARTPAELQALVDYTTAGGRVFMSHYHYDWLNGDAGFGEDNLADWSGAGSIGGVSTDGTIVRQLANGQPFYKGEALHDWLLTVDALVNDELPITQPKYDAVVTEKNIASQPWITSPPASGTGNAETMYFSFGTPVGGVGTDDAGNPTYCGRAVFSDLHVSATIAPTTPCSDYYQALGPACVPETTRVFPTGCSSNGLSPQEKVLEFMLFDLSSCVVPDSVKPPPPPTNGPQ